MASAAETVRDLPFNEERFVGLLEKLIGVTEHLQNNPASGLVPREDLASDSILELLGPFTEENGGPLRIQRVSFVEGRGNVIIEYPGTGGADASVSFVGSHLDVVPADPETWDRNPFELLREGDCLYGRGTTDCLGHVALITCIFAALAEARPALRRTVRAVFIANEENSSQSGIGVDRLAETGALEPLKAGPVYWLDSADSQPCIGTAGMMVWRLTAHGKLFHSGLPHRGINAIELAQEAVTYVQRRFMEDFPPHPREAEYNYMVPSTLKPTQMQTSRGSHNQIPATCTASGDIRVTPFYDVADVKVKVEEYVAAINADPQGVLSEKAPWSRFVLEDGTKGSVELEWMGEPENGIACDISSEGHVALLESTRTVLGDVKPYSITGSLPLVREMQASGFDLQISGFGLSSRYHAVNEMAKLSDLMNGFRIVSAIIARLEG